MQRVEGFKCDYCGRMYPTEGEALSCEKHCSKDKCQMYEAQCTRAREMDGVIEAIGSKRYTLTLQCISLDAEWLTRWKEIKAHFAYILEPSNGNEDV